MFIMTHLPPRALSSLPGNDKTAHFTGFVLLTLLYWLVRYGRERPNLRRKALYFTVLLIAIYAAMDECSQELVKGRDGNIYDWLADMGGMVAGLALVYVLRSWRQWLVAYWVTMFALTHWPGKDGAFVRLPSSWRQFQVVFVMMGYLGLTFLFWRAISLEPKFVVNKRLIGITLFILPIYALLDEWLSWAMQRGFDISYLFSALGGIALGLICSIALARHNVVFEEDYDPYSRTWRN